MSEQLELFVFEFIVRNKKVLKLFEELGTEIFQ
jgi:hypothetical protein